MPETVGFIKIKDYAVINLNNMIPIRKEDIVEIDLKIYPRDTIEVRRWKKLCIKELDWCQQHQKEIERLANELYRMYTTEEPFKKRKICLDFPKLEKVCNKRKERQV